MKSMERAEVQIQHSKHNPLVIGNKIFRHSNDYELTNEDVEKAKRELGETEAVRNNCLRKLREKLSKDNIKCRTDDEYLLRFLRCRKFKCKAAYEKIRFCHSKRNQNPEVFCTLPSNFEDLLNRNMFIYLPYRDEEGSIIFVDRFGRWDVQEQTIYGLLQFFQPIADVITLNPSCQINKIVGILDCKDTHIRQVTAALFPSTLKFWTSVWQNIYPWRVKYVILINCNKMVYMVLNACRYLLKKKIAERIVVIDSDMSKLHEYVKPEILPREYGGYLDDSECSITEHIMNNINYIRYEQSFGNT